jgi:hypothetical protein
MLKLFSLSQLLLLISFRLMFGQQTVGLFTYDSLAADGYTLFAPLSWNETYLIDNCGREINRWQSTYQPGNSVHLLEDGNLLYSCRMPTNSFPGGGGSGGRLEKYDWNNNLLWSWELNTTTQLQHHDVEPMPNGNILVLSWEKRMAAAAIANGRDTSILGNALWPEHILEIQPLGADSAVIVWEWKMWNHLIQDYDSAKINYGVVADHPELIDINYIGAGTGSADMAHFNAIRYNAALDQILVCSRFYCEFWILDHSTTTLEASGHTGGVRGKGGDILYRWGNPESYRRGILSDRKFFGPHDARWIEAGNPGEGNILIFNNGRNRPGGDYSTVEEVIPAIDVNGNYPSPPPNQPYSPDSSLWIYSAPVPADFYSTNISGAQRLINGNTLICEGTTGNFFEVDSPGNIHWNYLSPVGTAGIVAQGDNPPIPNVFKVRRYGSDFPGLAGQDLTPGNPLEGNPLPGTGLCAPASIATSPELPARIFPNPCEAEFQITLPDAKEHALKLLLPVTGQKIFESRFCNSGMVRVSEFPAGIYFILIDERNAGKISITH